MKSPFLLATVKMIGNLVHPKRSGLRLRRPTSVGDAARYTCLRASLVVLMLVAVGESAGCVRRKLTVNTEPQGAVVWLNDEEIGRSPATIDFLWYGDYDVVARLKGYQTLKTHERIVAPWYQTPGIDFVAEVLYPGWIVDSREMHFEMNPESLPTREALLENARLTREMALADPNKNPVEDVATETGTDADSMPARETNAENNSPPESAAESNRTTEMLPE